MSSFDKILVIVVSLQVLIFITSISAGDIPSTSPSTPNKTATSNVTKSSDNPQNVSHNMEILTEGGGIHTQIQQPSVNPRYGGREGETILNDPVINDTNSSSSASVPLNSSTTKVEVKASPSSVSSSSNSTTERSSIPIYENKSSSTSKDNAHKAISPRKGVNFTEYQLSSNVTTVKPKPKKPTLTVAADEEPYAPSHFQPLSKSNSSTSQSIPKVPNFDMLNDSNQGNTQKYVVPIVIVILSVPFVAILISILYKRGSEWWKYRHYRRMDFLINGMYDN